jgi:protein farnesyltransferase/geranylgeranyltransferase type-1 subunit alpha
MASPFLHFVRLWRTERELAFVKSKISLAPNNLSAWNYLRGILDKMGIKYATLRTFVEPYSISRAENEASARDEEAEAEVEVYDLDNPRPSLAAELPCALAIEFMADLCEQEGENDKAAEVCSIDHQHRYYFRLNVFPAFQQSGRGA